jgi:hypothetical protein
MKHTSRSLLLPFVLLFVASSCNLNSTSPDTDDCTSGRKTSTSPLGAAIILDSTRTDHFFQTSEAVDINCHGKFYVKVSYMDDRLRHDSTAPIPVEASFGTDFILGAGFKTTIKKFTDADIGSSPYYYWTIEADEGAKNLSDDQDWHYTWFAMLTDPKKAASILNARIDYKPKKK